VIAVASRFFSVGSVVPWARAGAGAVATQSFANTTFGPRGLDLLERGATPEEDRELREALLADPKERAEHVMLVDLARNDLGRVCEIGTVSVPRYAAVERYSHVQHIVSEVRGRLAADASAVDALVACFPAGTLTRAPKIRAMQWLDELESVRRGLYGGVVGYLDSEGNLDVATAIRMAVVEGGICRVQAGAGIVADSIPENEYREAESKAAAIFRAVELARAWSGSAPGKSLITDHEPQIRP
jgi:anthranilate synthase component 1